MCRALACVIALVASEVAAEEPVEIPTKEVKSDVIYQVREAKEKLRLFRYTGAVPLLPIGADRSAPSCTLMLNDLYFVVALMPISEVKRAGEVANDDVGIALFVSPTSASDTQKRHYTRWSKLTVCDELGNKYEQIRFKTEPPKEFKLAGEKTRIDGDRMCFDLLVFERPVAKAKSFSITFPGKNLELDRDLAVSFTTDDLKSAEGLAKKK
jgi:hypothetical protein